MDDPLSTSSTRAGVTGLAWRALHVAVPLVLITGVVWVVGTEEVLAQLCMAEWRWILAAVATCMLQTVLSAARWRLTARRLKIAIPAQRAVAEYFLSSLVNTTVPGGVVGDAWRAVRSRGGGGLEPAAQAVLIERLAGQIALGAVFVLGLAASGRPLLQGAAALVVVGLLSLIALGPRQSLPGRILPGVVLRFAAAIRHCWSGRRMATVQIALSLAIVAANVATFVLAARAAGTVIGPAEAIFAVPLILFAMIIPLSVAGWGYREGAAAAVFPLVGSAATAGVSASVIFGAVVLLAALPGLAVGLRHIRRPLAGPGTR